MPSPTPTEDLLDLRMLPSWANEPARPNDYANFEGEEADPTGVGINFMVREHFDEINAEFALTEGGGMRMEGSKVSMEAFAQMLTSFVDRPVMDMTELKGFFQVGFHKICSFEIGSPEVSFL